MAPVDTDSVVVAAVAPVLGTLGVGRKVDNSAKGAF